MGQNGGITARYVDPVDMLFSTRAQGLHICSHGFPLNILHLPHDPWGALYNIDTQGCFFFE